MQKLFHITCCKGNKKPRDQGCGNIDNIMNPTKNNLHAKLRGEFYLTSCCINHNLYFHLNFGDNIAVDPMGKQNLKSCRVAGILY